jgi:hypothetical protein
MKSVKVNRLLMFLLRLLIFSMFRLIIWWGGIRRRAEARGGLVLFACAKSTKNTALRAANLIYHNTGTIKT